MTTERAIVVHKTKLQEVQTKLRNAEKQVATLECERLSSEDPERMGVIKRALGDLRNDKLPQLRQDVKLYEGLVKMSEIWLIGAGHEIERAMRNYVLRAITFKRDEKRQSQKSWASSRNN